MKYVKLIFFLLAFTSYNGFGQIEWFSTAGIPQVHHGGDKFLILNTQYYIGENPSKAKHKKNLKKRLALGSKKRAASKQIIYNGTLFKDGKQIALLDNSIPTEDAKDLIYGAGVDRKVEEGEWRYLYLMFNVKETKIYKGKEKDASYNITIDQLEDGGYEIVMELYEKGSDEKLKKTFPFTVKEGSITGESTMTKKEHKKIFNYGDFGNTDPEFLFIDAK